MIIKLNKQVRDLERILDSIEDTDDEDLSQESDDIQTALWYLKEYEE